MMVMLTCVQGSTSEPLVCESVQEVCAFFRRQVP